MSAAQQYLALVFSESSVVAALWQKVGSRTQIIARSSLSPVTASNWVDAIDKALEELGPESLSVKKALFAVPSAWTQNGELIDSQRNFLKDLTKDLLLEPMGFVLVEDTLLAWQEDQLGENFTGTIITSTPENWKVQRVEAGVVGKTAEVGKSGTGTADWEELQAQLTQLAQDHRRGIYLDLAPSSDEYGQIIVKLRQLLQAPVEKIKPDQLAEIAIIQGGHEILSSVVSDQPTVETPVAPVEEETDNDFQTPDFVISTPTLSENSEESDMEAEPETAVDSEEEAPSSSASKFAFPRLQFGKIRFPKNRKVTLIGGIVAAIILLLGIGYAVLFTSYTAAIAIELEGQNLEKSETMALSATASDSAELFQMLAPEVIEETVTVEKEVPTTGTKITGDPAKGKVLIYNKTEDVKSFPAGTNLTLNGKIYKLDSDIQIASASSKESTGSRTIEFGSVETTATASFIGPDGNIGKNERFSVANFSSSTYEAVSQEDFSGGSSREIQAVSARDVTTATNDLVEQAKTQLEELFASQNDDEQQVFYAGETTTNSTRTSANIDEEASVVGVQLEVSGKAYKIRRDRLVETIESLFADQIPNGYIIQESTIQLTTERIIAGTPPKVELKIQARAVPDIQPSSLQQIVAGQYAARAKTLLEESPGVRTATITIKPEWAAALLPSVPTKAERVKFNLQLR
jgi:hypothetical protein